MSETLSPRPCVRDLWVRGRVSVTGVRGRVSENLIMPTTPALNKGSPLPCLLVFNVSPLCVRDRESEAVCPRPWVRDRGPEAVSLAPSGRLVVVSQKKNENRQINKNAYIHMYIHRYMYVLEASTNAKRQTLIAKPADEASEASPRKMRSKRGHQ